MSSPGIKLGLLARRSGLSRRTLLAWCQPSANGYVRLRSVRRGNLYFVHVRDAEFLVLHGTPPLSFVGVPGGDSRESGGGADF